MRIFMTVLLAGPRHSSIRVDDDHVEVKMGVGGWTFSADVPRSRSRDDRVTGPVWGWGARLEGPVAGERLSRGLVRLTLQPSVRPHAGVSAACAAS
jgi:hypothetical protein